MKGNDLSNVPTRRFWVISDAVLVVETVSREEKHWFRSVMRERTRTMPDLAALSKLWRYSSEFGVRLELVFIGQSAEDAPELWQLLEKGSANPFTDWLAFETYTHLNHDLPYRPDVLGIIDVPSRSLLYGGKGMTMEAIP